MDDKPSRHQDNFSEHETKDPLTALRIALNTPPKPHSAVKRKGSALKTRKRRLPK